MFSPCAIAVAVWLKLETVWSYPFRESSIETNENGAGKNPFISYSQGSKRQEKGALTLSSLNLNLSLLRTNSRFRRSNSAMLRTMLSMRSGYSGLSGACTVKKES